MTAVDFRNPLTEPAPFTRAEVEARFPSLPDNWTAADDVALMHGLGLGMKLGEIGAMQGHSLAAMQARFLALRQAAVGHGVFNLAAQEMLTAIVDDRFRAGVANDAG